MDGCPILGEGVGWASHAARSASIRCLQDLQTATGSSAAPPCLRQALRAVTKNCRPDWDIITPELRKAWQEGRKELSTPTATYAQTLGEEV